MQVGLSSSDSILYLKVTWNYLKVFCFILDGKHYQGSHNRPFSGEWFCCRSVWCFLSSYAGGAEGAPRSYRRLLRPHGMLWPQTCALCWLYHRQQHPSLGGARLQGRLFPDRRVRCWDREVYGIPTIITGNRPPGEFLRAVNHIRYDFWKAIAISLRRSYHIA